MRRNQKESGFTLLEIIIVIIIVGVLASLALPKFFKTVEYSRATEAFASLNAVRQSMERCYLQRTSYVGCDTFNNLDLENPANSPNNHFTYAWTGGVGATTFSIRAVRNTRDGGNTADYIQLVNDGTIIDKSGGPANGAFSGVQ